MSDYKKFYDETFEKIAKNFGIDSSELSNRVTNFKNIEMQEVRRNEFKDLLITNELMYVEHTDFIKADIPELGECTFYPKKNRLNIHKGNKWESDGYYFVKKHLNNSPKEKKQNVVKLSTNAVITEKRLVIQEWYETHNTNTGWGSQGWFFKDDSGFIDSSWNITEHLDSDKYGNPILGIAEKETEI